MIEREGTAERALRVAIVVGTRPEAVKMCAVHRVLDRVPFESVLISTGQHGDMLTETLTTLGLVPAHELRIMTQDQTPNQVASRILDKLPGVLADSKPDCVLVQGDTTTALAGALAAYYMGIPVGHVEAGLRTYNDQSPFPEEANRQVIARLAHWNFAPTVLARDNLLSEHVDPSKILVTGNTGIDTLLWVLQQTTAPPARPPYVLLTLHRRESFGEPLREILDAVVDFLDADPNAEVLWPVHPNPHVRRIAAEKLGQHSRVDLCEPLEYVSFATRLANARVVLSDSGGVQEEAPSLGKTVLIARETTERPEAVFSGQNILVGRDRERIREALRHAWTQLPYAGPLPAPNPYGDGRAAQRIAAAIAAGLPSKPGMPMG